jgi:uncharacterized damage-inducible protein DinB
MAVIMSVFTNSASSSPAETAAYVQALLDLIGDRAPLPILQGTAAAALDRIDDLSPAQLVRPERPGKWSIRHVLQHLADSELVWGWRLRLVLAQDRPRITGYDQDLWAERLGYEHADPLQAADDFATLRDANLRLLSHVGPAELERTGVHEERGEESIAHMMRLYAGHDLLHLDQIDRIRAVVTAAAATQHS